MKINGFNFIKLALWLVVFWGILIDGGFEAKAIGNCGDNLVWDGSRCRQIVIREGMSVIGLDQPVENREILDEIERNMVRASMPTISESLFNPDTAEKGQAIQDLRLTNWLMEGEEKQWSMEFIINESAKRIMDENAVKIGADGVSLWNVYAQAMSMLFDTTYPSIKRYAKTVRVVVASDNLVSKAGGGYVVVNETNYGWWASDRMNGVIGFIPYDVDYRTVVDEDYAQRFVDVVDLMTRYNGVAVDWGTIHEITHLLPVGDNYVYFFMDGDYLQIPQLLNGVNKTAMFGANALGFMSNDIMAGGSNRLTASSAYYILANWKVHPKMVRNAQFNPYYLGDETHIYSKYFINNLKITLDGLSGYGVDGCQFMRQSEHDGPILPVTATGIGVKYDKGKCELNINKDNQKIWSGFHLGLKRKGIVFPIYFPSVLLQTFYWQNLVNKGSVPDSFTFTLNNKKYFQNVLDAYEKSIVGSGNSDVVIDGQAMVAYMDKVKDGNLPSNTIFFGKIDGFDNKYIITYQLP